ncbi:SUMF1/EgtB/PvdO family nonheme iron enzyme [Micrococcus sp.]|uniref:SUMF1/EgtB/PvdO family nonheme iron enzyme n=1 Tax=Micrococcus sp. TaxID=1271 RepID=UPI0026DC98BD|nr:SUMF1/EgtB/PvdO family nonheme iron enzyme [Micrococcus sp.]MDO4238765.1 SUMF1/EgtB/PvdO family nonheme iron enzyme [Micrococcus sp.]
MPPLTTPAPQEERAPRLVTVPGGWFTMGSDEHYPEEALAHRVHVPDLEVGVTTVTNRQYERFVAETGHVTVAEQAPDPADYPGAPAEALVPGSVVFTGTRGPVDLTRPGQWWRWVPGASWRHPEGPGSHIEDRLDHPVVHVAHADAAAFAEWAGLSLPTEAEWEHAARGGLEGAAYAWGDELHPDGAVLANTWIGRFPWLRTGPAGVPRTCAVGTFPPNGYGLHEVCGNVWEWTDTWYAPGHAPDGAAAPRAAPTPPCCAPAPRGPGEDEARRREASYDPDQPEVRVPRRVLKGGSYLCSPDYCRRYRPAARQPQTVDTGTSHLGFRCVRRPSRPAPHPSQEDQP